MARVVRRSFPKKAKLVSDRFHVQQLAAGAVQKIRIKHRWEAIEQENKEMDLANRGMKRIFFIEFEKQTPMPVFSLLRNCVVFMFLLTGVVRAQSGDKETNGPQHLLCDLMDSYRSGNFHAVDVLNRTPAFSWEIGDGRPGIQQIAFQIIVSNSFESAERNEGNIWNSSKINSSQSSGIVYQGKPLQENKKYFWKVRIWNNLDERSAFSTTNSFQTAQQLKEYATGRYGLMKVEQSPVSTHNSRSLAFADFGKDAFAQLRLHLKSNNLSDTLIVRLGEAVNPKGTINRKPSGTIRYAEYKLPVRKGIEDYAIKFTPDKRNTGRNAIKMPDSIGEVFPFRYCEVEGYDRPLQPDEIIRTVVHYPFNETAAHFTSSDTLLNQIWDLCKYSIKATSFAGVYVDGDRERIPYEADALINQLSHYAVDKEFTLGRYSHEYLIYNATWPTEWILQSPMMAWTDYEYTGDLRSIKHHYKDLVAKTLMPLEDTNGLITVKKVTPEILKAIHLPPSAKLKDIVDWPHSGALGLGKEEAGETDGFVFTDYSAVSNAYYYNALRLLNKMAVLLNKHEDAEMFSLKAKTLKENFQQLLWDKDKRVYRDGISTAHASLHSNFFALLFGLVEKRDEKNVLDFIKSRGMACSVYGSQFLLDALYDYDMDDYALELLTAKNDRSWYNMMKIGSTITLEAWDKKYKPNLDWNHAWGAAPANIISRKLMGIEPLQPGWSKFKVEPKPGKLSSAEIIVPTIKGKISMSFSRANGIFNMQVIVPANTTADVYLPVEAKKAGKMLINDKNMPVLNNNELVFKEVPPGVHTFLIEETR